MKFLLPLLISSSAFAATAPTIPAQSCTNPSRGIVLVLPEIAAGKLAGDLQITRLSKVLVSIAAADVRDLTVADDGRSFAFSGNDTKATEIVRVKTARDSVDRLVVEVWIKDRGMIGFTCPKAHPTAF